MDTDCSTTLMTPEVVEECSGLSSVRAVDHVEVECRGSSAMEMMV